MKKLLLIIALAFSLTPSSAFAIGLDCTTDPNDTQCTCFKADGTTVTGDQTTQTNCIYYCTSDGIRASSYQYDACDGSGSAGRNNLHYDVRPEDLVTEQVTTATPGDSYATQISNAVTAKPEPVIPILNVPIPGLDLTGSVTEENGITRVNLMALYLSAAYRYTLIFGAVLAVVMLMVGGLEYTVSAGSSKRVEKAKTRIRNALVGLVLLFAAFNIAFLLDPRTTAFRSLDLRSVEAIEFNNETPADFNLDGPNPGPYVPGTADAVGDKGMGWNNVPMYSQNAYAHVAYGPQSCLTPTSGNIKSSGCGVTAFAMVVSALSGQTVYPPEMADSFYKEGFRPISQTSGCGVNGTYMTAFTESSYLKKYNLKSRVVPLGDHKQIEDLLKQKKMLIINTKNVDGQGGHYMAYVGLDESGNILINDPSGGIKRTKPQDWLFAPGKIKNVTYIDKAADFIP